MTKIVNNRTSFLVLVVILCTIATTQCTLSFEPAWPAVSVLVPVDLDYQSELVYATTLTGQIYSFANSNSLSNEPTLFFDIYESESPAVSFYSDLNDQGENGLTSLAFHPDYPTVPKFYVFYSATSTSIQVTAWEVDNYGEVDYTSADVLLTIPKVAALEARLGGDLQFNKGDLYISVGDGANSTAAQDLSNLLGKVLRITPKSQTTGYTVPSSNPFSNNPFGKNEIFSRGYRNPRKTTFGKSDKLFVGDVGDQYDELNKVDKGFNNGWSLYDGCNCVSSSCPSNPSQFKFPFYQYTSNNPHSITLGVYYPKSNDDASIESLENRILFADLFSGNVYSIQSTETNDNCGTDATFVANAPAFVSAFLRIGTDVFVADVFAAFYGNPSFYKLVRSSFDD